MTVVVVVVELSALIYFFFLPRCCTKPVATASGVLTGGGQEGPWGALPPDRSSYGLKNIKIFLFYINLTRYCSLLFTLIIFKATVTLYKRLANRRRLRAAYYFRRGINII